MKIWNMGDHRSWGDVIFFVSLEKRRVGGLTTPKPEKGDRLRVKLQSGKIGEFEFGEIEEQGDPRDMWFSTVKDIGYVESDSGTNPA